MIIVKWNKFRNLDNIRKCESCLIFDEKNNFKYCSKCKLCCYCSKECQIKHWKKDHKFRCNVEIHKLPKKERLEYRLLSNVLTIKYYENTLIQENSMVFKSNIKYWNVLDDPENIENTYILLESNKDIFIQYCIERNILYEKYIDKYNLILFGYNFVLHI
tara:strand:+ start:57 stop:536 length:480 start_codon:yes stop_codon:yes gene_type:complete